MQGSPTSVRGGINLAVNWVGYDGEMVIDRLLAYLKSPPGVNLKVLESCPHF